MKPEKPNAFEYLRQALEKHNLAILELRASMDELFRQMGINDEDQDAYEKYLLELQERDRG